MDGDGDVEGERERERDGNKLLIIFVCVISSPDGFQILLYMYPCKHHGKVYVAIQKSTFEK